MNYKVEYITRLFQKTSGKAIENYCLTRLWHKIDNHQVKMVPQQYVNRHTDKYALTDVYFPQIKMHVEVNEAAHYASEEKRWQDEIRKKEIESRTGHKLYVIDCRPSLDEIHKQIDKIAGMIHTEINNQKTSNLFKPWEPDTERNPAFWRDKKHISEADEVCFNNIEDICTLFGADFNKTKRGFLRLGGIPHPFSKDILLWWPSAFARQGWLNKLDEAQQTITETHADAIKKEEHYKSYSGTAQQRYVFFHDKDVLGLTSYRFKGVFNYDSENSNPETGTVWKKVSGTIHLNDKN